MNMQRLSVLLLFVFAMVTTACVAADLPISRVELFTSGVGYFERSGMVQGNTTIELTFRTEQINDILKSLVLQDRSGGRISPVTYAPEDPLEHTLSSFAINLADNPRLSELWDRLRGAQVRVAASQTYEGVVLGSEKQQKSSGQSVVTFEVLNLLTDKGVVQVPVWQLRSLKVLDAKLDADLYKALAAIDKARSTDRKPVTLNFEGTGQRQVSIGYLLSTPIWKTTYRLVNDKSGLFLQGWALVENTTDDDWHQINLSLVSGRPVSFTQNLYQPLYLPRPDVPVAVAAAARPRIYQGALERNEQQMDRARVAKGEMAGGFGGGGSLGAPAAPAAAPAPMAARGFNAASETYGPMLPSIASMAAGEKVGTLFQYAITQPVSIPRQRSAMIPIINEKITGEKVSVYNSSADAVHPMNGIKLQNTSKLNLMGGPITVFDGGAYGGDALIDDIAPGEERLLTYAIDLQVEVNPHRREIEQFSTARVSSGMLSTIFKSRSEVTYEVKNSADEKRVVLIEHPLSPEWQLIEPEKPAERTRDFARFRVEVAPGKTVSLKVIQERPRAETVALTGDSSDAVRLCLQRRELSPELRAALQKLQDMQNQLADLARQRTEKENRIKEIEAEQARLRQNMEQLDRQSELYKQYVDKLTKQETEFEALRGEIKDLRTKETDLQKQINDYVQGLEIR